MSPLASAPTRAMVLAAGFGLRMRPLTLTTPKPLLKVAGQTMLDASLEHLRRAGVGRMVVNHHYLGEQIIAHCAALADVTLSDERDAVLETGGGVARALPLLGDQPFYVCNADILWRDGPGLSALARLAAAWDDSKMDALLLLHPVASAFGYEGAGDYGLAADGRAQHRGASPRAPYVFTGVQILHPRLMAARPVAAHFPLRVLYDAAEAQGRLFGLIHDGGWFHIGTPEALAALPALITP